MRAKAEAWSPDWGVGRLEGRMEVLALGDLSGTLGTTIDLPTVLMGLLPLRLTCATGT